MSSKPKITLTTGLPASGKSTWAMMEQAEADGRLMRVNLDDIREMIGISPNGPIPWSKELEKTANKIHDNAILSAVSMGHDVIVDNTHLNPTTPKRIKNLFDGDVEFAVKDFTHISVEDCIKGDDFRAQYGGRRVGEDVIRDMAKQLRKPWRLTAEWMNDYMFTLEPLPVDDDLPLAAVWDIDGTLARHNRSPFDYSRVMTDSVIEPQRQKLKFYYDNGYTIFLFSGRPHVWNGLDIRKDTEIWLDKMDIPYDELHMRDGITQSNWNDADVKHNLINTILRGQYNTELWSDDRDRVVRRVRKIGIPVDQVAPGDF